MTHSPSIYSHVFQVPESALDQNGHVNNVVYVQWMQDLAIDHYQARGGHEVELDTKMTWVAHTHHIEYFKPAFAGDEIRAVTWVSDFKAASSLRCYRFLRSADNTLLAKGETDWVFVDAERGRPRRIPLAITQLLTPIKEDEIEQQV